MTNNIKEIPGFLDFKVDIASKKAYINGTWYDFKDILDYSLKEESHKTKRPIYKGEKTLIGRLAGLGSNIGIDHSIAEATIIRDFDDDIPTTYTISITIYSFDNPEEILKFDTNYDRAKRVERYLEIILKQNG